MVFWKKVWEGMASLVVWYSIRRFGIEHVLELQVKLRAGEWRDGMFHGTGRLDDNTDGSVTEATFVNGKLEGPGVIRWVNGDDYRGNFKNDRQKMLS